MFVALSYVWHSASIQPGVVLLCCRHGQTHCICWACRDISGTAKAMSLVPAPFNPLYHCVWTEVSTKIANWWQAHISEVLHVQHSWTVVVLTCFLLNTCCSTRSLLCYTWFSCTSIKMMRNCRWLFLNQSYIKGIWSCWSVDVPHYLSVMPYVKSAFVKSD